MTKNDNSKSIPSAMILSNPTHDTTRFIRLSVLTDIEIRRGLPSTFEPRLPAMDWSLGNHGTMEKWMKDDERWWKWRKKTKEHAAMRHTESHEITHGIIRSWNLFHSLWENFSPSVPRHSGDRHQTMSVGETKSLPSKQTENTVDTLDSVDKQFPNALRCF